MNDCNVNYMRPPAILRAWGAVLLRARQTTPEPRATPARQRAELSVAPIAQVLR